MTRYTIAEHCDSHGTLCVTSGHIYRAKGAVPESCQFGCADAVIVLLPEDVDAG